MAVEKRYRITIIRSGIPILIFSALILLILFSNRQFMTELDDILSKALITSSNGSSSNNNNNNNNINNEIITTKTTKATKNSENIENIRILCFVLTSKKNHKTKAVHVKRTWGKRCNRLLFVTSEPDDELETIITNVDDNYLLLWGKTRDALRHIYEKYYNETDWFIKTDDDTYVFLENLRFMLSAFKSEMPIYFGYNYNQNNNLYMSGGAGYVLSREAVRRFVEISLKDKQNCRVDINHGAEDLEMGKCLQAADVVFGDSRDETFKERFSPIEPFAALISNYFPEDFWIYNYSYFKTPFGRDYFSNHAISFHYVGPESFYVYEYFNYEFEAFGLYELPTAK